MDHWFPPVAFHFRVGFDLPGFSEKDARFQEVTGLSVELGVEELVEGGENRFIHRLPTRPKYGNLILKRGFLDDSDLAQWLKDGIENFQFTPVDVLVTLLNEEHEPLAGWSYVGAWPVKWAVSELKAQENTLVIETLELSYKYFRRI
jgi:phage tail-like protein